MKVKEIMSKNIATCRATTKVSDLGLLMKKNDCGIVPVVDDDNQVIGAITDRDICLELCETNRLSQEVEAKEFISDSVYCCKVDDDIYQALQEMKEHKVRRLPVIDGNQKLAGIISLNDIVLFCSDDFQVEDKDELIKTIQSISEHRPSNHAA